MKKFALCYYDGLASSPFFFTCTVLVEIAKKKTPTTEALDELLPISHKDYRDFLCTYSVMPFEDYEAKFTKAARFSMQKAGNGNSLMKEWRESVLEFYEEPSDTQGNSTPTPTATEESNPVEQETPDPKKRRQRISNAEHKRRIKLVEEQKSSPYSVMEFCRIRDKSVSYFKTCKKYVDRIEKEG